MNWWRAHHGISNDAKLALVAHRAKAKKCEVGWIWITLLDRASQAEERGSVDGLDAEEISLASDIPVQKVEAILEALRSKSMISRDNVLTSWDKRQPRREREDETSSERVKRFREKKHHETPVKHHETPCNATKRPEESRESRTEQKRESAAARVVPMPQPIDYGARYRVIYDRHIVAGFMQEGEHEYFKLIDSTPDPAKTADAIEAAHVEWTAFYFDHPQEYRPGIGKWLKDGYWTRQAKARDSPAKNPAQHLSPALQKLSEEMNRPCK